MSAWLPSAPDRLGCLALVAWLACMTPARAQSVLTFKYTPAARAQLAIWIEDAQGRFLATVALTEAVGYRGIGNRPGASDMNSGYRWPYGRREGVLPIWAQRRAAAPGAQLFPRVIFQDRVEGKASRTTSDQSPDDYYCLQFDKSKSTLDELDAVSCATPFTSDKGRYLTAQDVASGYAEPYEPSPGQGVRQPLPLGSHYPPRMDVTRCTASGCFDHADVERYAEDARAVMPEIDTVTIATAQGDTAASVLFSVPAAWPAGEYAAYLEINVEGDYNEAWNAERFPTPKTPQADRDSYSYDYGYPYRGQPSLVWRTDFILGGTADSEAGSADPIGRSAWNWWAQGYGEIEPISYAATDPNLISRQPMGSGAARLAADASGRRFVVQVGHYQQPDTAQGPTEPPATGETPRTWTDAGAAQNAPAPNASAPAAGRPDASTDDAAEAIEPETSATPPGVGSATRPGPVHDLRLSPYDDPLRADRWVRLRMRAAASELPLHAYEVRVATDPIIDEASFLRNGRQAKNATDAKEGPSYLQLPTDVPAGEWIEATIGDLAEQTHYYVGVRARSVNNAAGPLALAEITTPRRTFATVTPCFIATVAYGSPLATEVAALRRLRDRYLLPQELGRAWVSVYYRAGGRLATWAKPHPILRRALRVLLAPLLALARRLD